MLNWTAEHRLHAHWSESLLVGMYCLIKISTNNRRAKTWSLILRLAHLCMTDSMGLRDTFSILCSPTHLTFTPLCVEKSQRGWWMVAVISFKCKKCSLDRLMFLLKSQWAKWYPKQKNMIELVDTIVCGQSHCSSQGQGEEAPFHSKPQAFVLVLKTLHLAPLAILRGEGQHCILPFGGGGGGAFMKCKAKMVN